MGCLFVQDGLKNNRVDFIFVRARSMLNRCSEGYCGHLLCPRRPQFPAADRLRFPRRNALRLGEQRRRLWRIHDRRRRALDHARLILSQANVRRIKAGISVEDLAEDIARRGLLQGLGVRAVRDPDGQGRRDYTCGRNHFAPLSLLDDIPALAGRVRAVIAAEGGNLHAA
jgi:hypothetical protein